MILYKEIIINLEFLFQFISYDYAKNIKYYVEVKKKFLAYFTIFYCI